MKIMRKNLIGIANLHISTIFLLNAGTVPTVWYIFFHFIIGYEKKTAELQLLKKNMVVIVFRN
jgi:ABC-type anion transport system duplicated permease subunit